MLKRKESLPMTTHPYPLHDGEHQYVFDHSLPFTPENPTEIARQLLLHHKLTELMDGPLPASLDLTNISSVLDVGCGAGGWIHEMALHYTTMELTGIDHRHYFIKQAQAMMKEKS